MMSVIGSKIRLLCYSNRQRDNSSTISSTINIRLFLFLKVFGDLFEVRLKSHNKTERKHTRQVSYGFKLLSKENICI